MSILHAHSRRLGQRGNSLVELLVSLGIAAIVLTAAASNFIDGWRRAKDHEMIYRANTEVRTLMDLIVFDVRMLGSGMPLGQSGFALDDAALGTAPLPILTSSSSSQLDFRLNEMGASTVLTAQYTPSSSSLSFTVASIVDFEVGDTVYLNDMSAAGVNGLRGTISSVSGSTISIQNSYNATSGAIFKSGTIVERVTRLIYDSPADWSGITRNAELGAVLLSPRSSFSVEYLNGAGAALALPLTTTSIKNDLTSVRLTVQVRSPRPMLNGQVYTATAQQLVALRNLNYNR